MCYIQDRLQGCAKHISLGERRNAEGRGPGSVLGRGSNLPPHQLGGRAGHSELPECRLGVPNDVMGLMA